MVIDGVLLSQGEITMNFIRITCQSRLGPMLAMAAVLAAHRPRLYITNSALHNPTGATMTPSVAHRLLALCRGLKMTLTEISSPGRS